MGARDSLLTSESSRARVGRHRRVRSRRRSTFARPLVHGRAVRDAADRQAPQRVHGQCQPRRADRRALPRRLRPAASPTCATSRRARRAPLRRARAFRSPRTATRTRRRALFVISPASAASDTYPVTTIRSAIGALADAPLDTAVAPTAAAGEDQLQMGPVRGDMLERGHESSDVLARLERPEIEDVAASRHAESAPGRLRDRRRVEGPAREGRRLCAVATRRCGQSRDRSSPTAR